MGELRSVTLLVPHEALLEAGSQSLTPRAGLSLLSGSLLGSLTRSHPVTHNPLLKRHLTTRPTAS